MRVLYISLFVIITDQFSKLFVKGFSIPFLNINVEGMRYGQSINVIGDFFKLTFVENPGMAFGIEVGSLKVILSLFSLIAAIAILIYIYKVKEESIYYRVALALILGGAFGNFIDRAFYGVAYGYGPLMLGKVVDFLNFEFWDFTIFGHTYERWPIFNIADSAVTVGVFILIVFHRKFENQFAPEKVEKLPAEDSKESEENVESDLIESNKEEIDDKSDNRKETQI